MTSEAVYIIIGITMDLRLEKHELVNIRKNKSFVLRLTSYHVLTVFIWLMKQIEYDG